MIVPTLSCKLSDYFATRNDVAFAYLFGSASSGRATVESDVDIAVYLRDTKDPTNPLPDIEEPNRVFPDEDKIWTDTERICASEVDLVILNRAPATIAAGAMLTGTLLHSADEYLRTTYFLAVTTIAEDLREFAKDFVSIKTRSGSLSEVDRSRLVRIVDFLEDELSDASSFADMNIERYSTDRDFRRSVERWVENLANASIDAAKIVLASECRPVPQTYRDTVELLATVKGFHELEAVIRRIAANTRIRNLLAHEYLDLRFTQVSAVVANSAEAYGALVAALRSWMR